MEMETLVSEVVMIDLVYWDSYCIIGYGPIVICPNPPTQEQNCLAHNESNVSQYVNSRRDIGTDVDSGESSGGERVIEILETDVDSGRSCRRPGLIEIQVKHFSFEDGELIENTKTSNSDNEEDESVSKTTETDETDKDIRCQLDGILSKKNTEMDHSCYLSPASQNEYQVNADDSLNPDSTSNSVSNGLLSTTFDSLSDDVFETESQTEARRGLLMYTLHRSKGNLDLRVENTSDSTSTNVQKSEENSDDEGDEKTSEYERSSSQENFKANEEINEAKLEQLDVKKSGIIGSCDETMSLSLESLSTDLTGSSQSGSYSLLSLFDSETEVDRKEEIITVRKSDSFEHKTKHVVQQLHSKRKEKNDVFGTVAIESLENSEAKALDNHVKEGVASASLSSQLNIDGINAESDVSEETILKIESNDKAASVDINVSEKKSDQDNVSCPVYFKDVSSEKIEGRCAETCEKMEEGNAKTYMTQNDTSNLDASAIESKTEILTQRQIENDVYEGNDSDDTSESMSVSVDLEICVRVDLGTARDRGDKLFQSQTNNEDGTLELEESSSNEYSFLAYTRMFKDKRHQQLIENKSASQNSFQKDSAEKIAKQIVEKVLRASQNMVAETTDKALSERTGHLMEITDGENENQLLFKESKQKMYGYNTESEIETPIKDYQLHQEKSHDSVQQNEHRSANADNIHEKDLTEYDTDGTHIFENGYQGQTNRCMFHMEEKKSGDTEDEVMPEESVQHKHEIIETKEVESLDTNDNQKQAEEAEQVLKEVAVIQGQHLGRFDVESKKFFAPSEQQAGIYDSEKLNVKKSFPFENKTYPDHSEVELKRVDTIETEEVKIQREERVEIESNTELSDIGHKPELKATDIDDNFNSKIKNTELQNDEPHAINDRHNAETNEQHFKSQEKTTDMLKVISTDPKEKIKSEENEYMPDLFETNEIQTVKLDIEVKVDGNQSVQKQETHEAIETAKNDELLETDNTSDTQEDIEARRKDEQFETDHTIKTQEDIESTKSDKEPVNDNIETQKDVEIAKNVEQLQTYSTIETQEDIETSMDNACQEENGNTIETQGNFEVDKSVKQLETDSTIETQKCIEAAEKYEKPVNDYTIENQKDVDAAKSDEHTEVDIYMKTQEDIKASKSDYKNEIYKSIETNEDIQETESEEQSEIDKAIEIAKSDEQTVKSDEQQVIDSAFEYQEDTETAESDKQSTIGSAIESQEDIVTVRSDVQPEIDKTVKIQGNIETANSDEQQKIDSSFKTQNIESAKSDKQVEIENNIETHDDNETQKRDRQPETNKATETRKDFDTAKSNERQNIKLTIETPEDIETASSDKQSDINDSIEKQQKIKSSIKSQIDIEAARNDDKPDIYSIIEIVEEIEDAKSNIRPELDNTIEMQETTESAGSNKQTEIDYTIRINEQIEAGRDNAQYKIESTIESRDDVEATKSDEQQKMHSVEIQEDIESAYCDGVTEIDSTYDAHGDIEAAKSDEQPEINETIETQENIEAGIGAEIEFDNTSDAREDIEAARSDEQPQIDETIETQEKIDATKIDETPEIDYNTERQTSSEVAKNDEQPETVYIIDTEGSFEGVKCDKQPEIDYTFETEKNIEAAESDLQPEVNNTIEIVGGIEASRSEKQPADDKTIKTEEDIGIVKNDDHREHIKVTGTQEDIEAAVNDEDTEVDCTVSTQKDIETAKNYGKPEIENTFETNENIEDAKSDEQPDIVHSTETQGDVEASGSDYQEVNDKATETQEDTEGIISDEQFQIVNTIESIEGIETAKSDTQPFKDNTMETLKDIEASKSDELAELDSNKWNQEDIDCVICDGQQEIDSTVETQKSKGSARCYKQTENDSTTGNKEDIVQVKREKQLDIDNSFEIQEDKETSKTYKHLEIVDTIETQEDTKAAKIYRQSETDNTIVTQEDIETAKKDGQIEIDITIETEEDIEIARNDELPEIDNSVKTQNAEASKIDKQQEIYNICTIESQEDEIILVDKSEAEKVEKEVKVSDILELENVHTCNNLGNTEKFQSDRKTELANSQQVYSDTTYTHKIQTAGVEDKTVGGQKDKQQNMSLLNNQQDETVGLETKVQNPKNEHQTEEQEISDSFETEIDSKAEKGILRESGCYTCDLEFDMSDNTKMQEVNNTDTESNFETEHIDREHCTTDTKSFMSCEEEVETEDSVLGLKNPSLIKAQEETGMKGNIETEEIDQEQNTDETNEVKPSCFEANKSEQELQISSSIKAQEVKTSDNEDKNAVDIQSELSDAVFGEKEGTDIVCDAKMESSSKETDMCYSKDIQGKTTLEMENKSEAQLSQQVKDFPENTETQETKAPDGKLEASESEGQSHIQNVELNGIKEIVEVLQVCQQAEMAEELVKDKVTSDIHLTGDVEQCGSQTKVIVEAEHGHQCKINSLRKRYQRKETKRLVCSSDTTDDSSDSIDDTGQYHPELYEQLTVPVCKDSEVESLLVKPDIGYLLGSKNGKSDENKEYNEEINEQEIHMSENEINQPEHDSIFVIKEQKDDKNLKQNIPDECQVNTVSCIDIENVVSSDEDSEDIDDSGQYHPELYVKRPELDCSDTDKVSMNATNVDNSNIVLSKDKDCENLHNKPKENLQSGVGKDKQMSVLSVSAYKPNIGEKKDGTVTQHAEYSSDSDTDSESIDDTGQYHPELYTQLTLPLGDIDKNGGNNNEEPSAKNGDTNKQLQEARLSSSKGDHETDTFDTNAGISDYTSGPEQDIENSPSSSGESEGLHKYVENVGKNLKVSSSHIESMGRNAGSAERFQDVSGDFKNTEGTFNDSDISESAFGGVGVTGLELRDTASQNVVHSSDIKDRNTRSNHKPSSQVQEHFDEVNRIPIEVSVKINDMPGKTKKVQESKKKSRITNASQEITDIKNIDVHMSDKKMDNSEINMFEVEENNHAKEKSERKNNKRPGEYKNADKHTVGVKEDTLAKGSKQNRESRSKTVKQQVESEDIKKKSKSKSKSPDNSHHNKKELSCYPGDDELVSVKSEKLRAADKVTDSSSQVKEEKERKKHSKRSEERKNETKKDVKEKVEEERVREGKSNKKKAKDSEVSTVNTELSYINKAEDENMESKKSGSTSHTVKRSKHGTKKETGGNHVEVIHAEIHSQRDRENIEDVMKDEFDVADDEDVKSKSENSTKKEEQNSRDKPVDLSSSDQQGNGQTNRKRSVDGKISGPLADDIDEDIEGSVDPTVVSHKLEKWLQEKRDISIRKETERFIKGVIPEEKLHIKQRVQATANEQRRQRSRDEIEIGYSRRERSRHNSLEQQYRRSRQGSQEQIYRSPDGVYGRSRHNSQEGIYVSRRGSQEGLYRRSRQNSVDGILERSSYSSQEGKLIRSRKSSQDEGVRSYMDDGRLNSPDGRFSRNSQSSQEEINERFRNRYQNEAVHETNRYNSQNERYIRSRHNSIDQMYRHSGDGQENDILKGRDVYERHKHGSGEISDHKKYKDDDIYGYNEEQKNNRKDVFEKCRQCSHDDMYERKELSRQNSSEQLNESRKSPVFDEEFLEGRLGRKADYIEVKKFRRENKINDKRRANFLTSAQLRIFCEPKKKNDKPIIGPVEMVSVSYERQKSKENERKAMELNSSIEKTKNIDEHSSYSSTLQPKTFDVYRYEKHHKRGHKSNLKLDKMDRVDNQYRDNRVQLNESGFSHKDWEHCQIHNRNVSAAETSHSELYHVNQYSKNRCAKKHDASVGTKVVTANANQGNGDAFYLSDPDYVHARSKYQQNLRGQKYPKNPNGPKDNSRMRIPAGSRETSKDGPLSLTDTFAPMERGHSENHNMSNPNLSAGKLSDSTTSLNNRQAPAKSPSRQNTLQKQTSVQSNQSEINGEKRDDPHGIKFERLKNLEEDELMSKIKEIIGHLEKLEDYHRGDGMRIQKMLGDMYWDYTHLREMIADCMAENGYAVVSMKMLKTLNGIGIFKNDDVWFPTYYTYNTMWNFSDASSNLARTLSENDAVRLLTLNCGHKPYINALHSKNVFYVIKASLSILHNMARNSGMKHLFDENKTSETVMPFMESEDEMLKILATLTIANIVDEEENKTVIAETGTIHCMVSWIEKAISLPRRRFKGFTPQELTEGLNKLAVNDSNKMRIIEEGAIPLFHLMLQHDDVREQSSAGRIIWTLSFDKDVRHKLIENTDLIATLEKLTESTNKSVQQNASGALWIIKGENDISRETKPKGTPTKSHVFLSYSWSDKDTVLMIRDKLRSEGYAVWIDIEKGSSASLEGMANAVENSAVVLICMSEKYKQNPNCRTEAEYTFQLKKDYIPLMLQKKYRPDGWLGFILGAKLYFDFSGKYPFDKSFTGLLKELRGRGQVTPNTTPVGSNETSDGAMATSQSLTSYVSPGTPVPSHSVLLAMGQEELVKWLRNVKLTECIPAFLEFDGKLLMQLKQMRVEAPEFFYQCLEKRLNMSLIEILKFTRALEELH